MFLADPIPTQVWKALSGPGRFFFLENDAKLREEVLRSMGTVGGGIRDCM